MSDLPDGVELDLSPDIVILTRLNVLAHVVREVLGVVQVADRSLDLVRDAIRERVLARISVLLPKIGDHSSKALLEVEIDWVKHALLLRSETQTDTFAIDSTVSVSGQVSEVLDVMVAYIKRRSEAYDLGALELVYEWRNGPDSAKAIQDLRDRYSLKSVGKPLESALAMARIGRELSLSPSSLGEVALTFTEPM